MIDNWYVYLCLSVSYHYGTPMKGTILIYWVVVSNIFYFQPYLGKIPILTNIFQMGWNHQLVYIFGKFRHISQQLPTDPYGISSLDLCGYPEVGWIVSE